MSRSSELNHLRSRLAAAKEQETSTPNEEPAEHQKIHLLTPTGKRT